MISELFVYFITPAGPAHFALPFVPTDLCILILEDVARAIQALGWGKVAAGACVPMT